MGGLASRLCGGLSGICGRVRMGTRVENAADSHKISVPVARILDRCRMERAPEAQMQMPEKAESCDRQLAIQSHADLTVVSGYLECFLLLTTLAVLGIAARILGILQ